MAKQYQPKAVHVMRAPNIRGVWVACTLGACIASALIQPAFAQAQAMPLKLDQPAMVSDTEVACAGVGTKSRDDPRWAAYPLKLEFAVPNGAFLGKSTVMVSGKGERPPITVQCDGPWVLFRLPPGQYAVNANVSDGAASKSATVDVPASGQRAVTMIFPSIAAAISSPPN